MNIPYVKAGAPFIDHPSSPDATFAAVDANTLDDGIYAAHLMPAVRAYHNTNQSINNTTLTALALNSERFDQAGGAASTQHDTSSNNSRLTCRFAGIYDIRGLAEFANNSTGARELVIRLNGVDEIGSVLVMTAVGFVTLLSVSAHWAMAVNDYVELMAYQSSGGALNVVSTAKRSPEFSMVRVG